MKPLPNPNGARSLAQEAVSWYLDQIDPLLPHAANVIQSLRGPVIALTASILKKSSTSNSSNNGKSVAALTTSSSCEASNSTWREYLNLGEADASLSEYFTSEKNSQDYINLSQRSKARLDAFLEGVALSVVSETHAVPIETVVRRPASRAGSTDESSFSLIEGLVGFRSMEVGGKGKKSVLSTLKQSGLSNSSTTLKKQKQPQLPETELVVRLELYLRSLHRVVLQQHECVIAQEPPKALKARTRALVAAFVDTVGTVQHVSPVLTRLLLALTKELLAVTTISGDLRRIMRNIVSSYVHTTSFASLAFLSSPETAADQRLTPAILKYLLYMKNNWQLCEAGCTLELMLSTVLDRNMRNMFKTAEFLSIGHLLEVCQSYRDELQSIQLPPSANDVTETEKLEQAMKDLQREVICVNGSVLPHVSTHSDLLLLLASALNTRAVFDGSAIRRRGKKKKKRSGNSSTTSGSEESDGFLLSSGNEADQSESSSTTASPPAGKGTVGSATNRPARRRSKFRSSTVDLLTKRLLLAASRTGTGGDAYFVVRDMFGGEDVEVVPSKLQPGAIRPATIDLLVRLASVTIKCHASFDVYPRSMVGDCEPLIQIHTTTTESIALQEVRASDQKEALTETTSDDGPVMVLQERQTEASGPRVLSVRPALYEKVSVWHTPS